jgi:hypothetical protein
MKWNTTFDGEFRIKRIPRITSNFKVLGLRLKYGKLIATYDTCIGYLSLCKYYAYICLILQGSTCSNPFSS